MILQVSSQKRLTLLKSGDTQNDAMFERKYILQTIIFGIYLAKWNNISPS